MGKQVESAIWPHLNKKLFPVYCPSGFKRADWNSFSFFFMFLKKSVFFL